AVSLAVAHGRVPRVERARRAGRAARAEPRCVVLELERPSAADAVRDPRAERRELAAAVAADRRERPGRARAGRGRPGSGAPTQRAARLHLRPRPAGRGAALAALPDPLALHAHDV